MRGEARIFVYSATIGSIPPDALTLPFQHSDLGDSMSPWWIMMFADHEISWHPSLGARVEFRCDR
jgi:hypothetical protein